MIIADAPALWLPPKPAVIRPAEHALLKPGAFAPATREERRALMAELVRSRRMTPAEARQAIFFVPVASWVAAPPTVVTYLGEAISAGATASPSFPNCALGAAASNRYIVVALTSINSGSTTVTLNTLTVGGMPAALL